MPSRWSISCCRQRASRPSASISCGRALAIEVAHPDLIEPRHLAELLGQAETALFGDVGGLRARDDLGVDDEHRRALALPAEIGDERPLGHADLRRGEADPGAAYMVSQHVVEQAQELRVDPLDRRAMAVVRRRSGASMISSTAMLSSGLVVRPDPASARRGQARRPVPGTGRRASSAAPSVPSSR